ncbi:hypothetical protein ABZ714_25215, partial [Streptomyces sp. NPDC006798]
GTGERVPRLGVGDIEGFAREFFVVRPARPPVPGPARWPPRPPGRPGRARSRTAAPGAGAVPPGPRGPRPAPDRSA